MNVGWKTRPGERVDLERDLAEELGWLGAVVRLLQDAVDEELRHGVRCSTGNGNARYDDLDRVRVDGRVVVILDLPRDRDLMPFPGLADALHHERLIVELDG